LTFGSHTANSQVDFTDSIDLNGPNQNGGNRQIDVAAGAGGDSAMISGNIIDSVGGGGLLKTGAGTVVLTANNTYGGTTIISGGALQAVDGVGLPSSSNLVFNGNLAQNGYGAVFQSSGTFSRAVGNGAGQVQWTGDGGFAANGGPLTISLSPGVPLVWNSVNNNNGTPGFLGDLNVLTFGSHTANNQVDFTDGIDLNGPNQNGGNRQIDVTAGAGGDSALISGNIIDSVGGGGLLKTGAGTLILSGSNSYTGGTIVSNGALVAASAYALPAGTSLTVGAGGTFIFDPMAIPAPLAASPGAAMSAVPEPSSFALLGAGAIGLLTFARPQRLPRSSRRRIPTPTAIAPRKRRSVRRTISGVKSVVPLRGTGEAYESEPVGSAALHPRLLEGDRYAVAILSNEGRHASNLRHARAHPRAETGMRPAPPRVPSRYCIRRTAAGAAERQNVSSRGWSAAEPPVVIPGSGVSRVSGDTGRETDEAFAADAKKQTRAGAEDK